MGICGSNPKENKGEKYKDPEVEAHQNKNYTARNGNNSHFDNIESLLNQEDKRPKNLPKLNFFDQMVNQSQVPSDRTNISPYPNQRFL